MLAEANSEAARKQAEAFRGFMDLCDTEEAAPSAGLRVHTEKVVSAAGRQHDQDPGDPPDNDEALPCVYYIHGGGMATLSCYDGNYRGWGRIIAANGVAVVMVDFRNAVSPSSAPEVAPFPAGFNDCVSGLKWVAANAAHLGIDPDRIVSRARAAAATSPWPPGYAQARRRSRPDQGSLRAVPLHRRLLAAPENPSSTENNGILLDLHNNRGAMGYGIEAFDDRNPLAWPGFATATTSRASRPR